MPRLSSTSCSSSEVGVACAVSYLLRALSIEWVCLLHLNCDLGSVRLNRRLETLALYVLSQCLLLRRKRMAQAGREVGRIVDQHSTPEYESCLSSSSLGDAFDNVGRHGHRPDYLSDLLPWALPLHLVISLVVMVSSLPSLCRFAKPQPASCLKLCRSALTSAISDKRSLDFPHSWLLSDAKMVVLLHVKVAFAKRRCMC